MPAFQVGAILVLGGCVIWLACTAMRFAGPTVYYVSNAASHGYARGSDKNNGLSRSTPFLTFAKAVQTSVANGDVINGNPSGVPYDENSGGFYHGLIPGSNAVTIESDPTLTGTVTITAAASDRVLETFATGNVLTLNSITFDGSNSHNAITPNGAKLALNNCDFQNIPAGCFAIGYAAPNWSWSLNKCRFESSVTDALNIQMSTSGGLTLSGCTSQVTGATVYGGGTGNSVANVKITAAADGTPTTASGVGAKFFAIYSGGLISNLTVDHTKIHDLAKGLYTSSTTGTGTSMFGSVTIDNCTATGVFTDAPPFAFFNAACSKWNVYSNSFNASGGLLIMSELATNVSIHDNTFTTTASAGTLDALAVGPVGANAVITNNTIVNNNATPTSTHALLFGLDGPTIDSSNSGITGTRSVGNAPGTSFLDQTFTTSPLTFAGRSSTVEGILIAAAVQGAKGSLSAKLFSDANGLPGSLIEVSPTSYTAGSLSGTPQDLFFEFRGHSSLSPATKYHLVLSATGTDASDYFILSKNGNTGNGSLSTSGDGVTWTADHASALVYSVRTGSFAATGALISGNSISCAVNGSAQNHGLICGCVPAPMVYRNLVVGGGPVMPIKDCYGGWWFDNLVFTSTGTQEPLTFKSSINCKVLQSTLISTSPTMSAVVVMQGDQNLGAFPPLPSNNTVMNCILVSNPPNGKGWLYHFTALGSGNAINNNCAYAGPFSQVEASVWPSWSAWQGAGFDKLSTTTNPLLKNSVFPATAADFVPSTQSPVAKVGANLLASVPSDFYGNGFTSTPAAGAFSAASFH